MIPEPMQGWRYSEIQLLGMVEEIQSGKSNVSGHVKYGDRSQHVRTQSLIGGWKVDWRQNFDGVQMAGLGSGLRVLIR